MANSSAKLRSQTSVDFFKHQVLPFLAVFIIPAFSLWFFSHAESKYDTTMLERIRVDVPRDRSLTPEEKKQILAYYEATPVSKILASDDPEMAEQKEIFRTVTKDYKMFFWARWVAGGCLVVVLATLLIVGVSVAASFRSQAYQYYSLKFGWSVLRVSAFLQVLGQAALAVALSYWITALWFDSYVPKLIFVIGLLAVFAVIAMVKAIFHRIKMVGTVEGELITEEAAPELWRRVRDFAKRMNTAPPERIVTGIDASFFVTENPVQLGDQVLYGRTLYVSLPMLKIMTTDEADAVLGHEMAHFGGEDTLWSQKIAPIIGSMEIHIAMLADGMSKPVAYFMHFFWKLYQISLSKLSRVREFRADRLGAEVTSADACKRALVKTSSYCQFRGKVEDRVMNDVLVNDLNLAKELESGYPEHLKAFTQSDESFSTEVAHPFDTHPKLSKRLENLGFDKSSLKTDESLLGEVSDSWYHKIKDAATLEERLWKDREDLMQGVKKENLAWTCLPEGEAEIAIVEAGFPELKFQNKAGEEVVINYRQVSSAAWPDVIEFAVMDKILAEDSLLGGKRITIQYKVGTKMTRVRYNTKKFPGTTGMQLAEAVNRYFLRHCSAQYHAKFKEMREGDAGRK